MRTRSGERPGLEWPGAILPVRRGRFSARIELRSAVVTGLVLVAALACAAWSLTIGSAGLGLDDLLAALRGEADAGAARALLEWRMPRTVFALLGGAALAVGGAVFQSITRNPLGSPDIIGFSTGAYTGALLVMVFGGNGSLATSLGALAGGVLTGAVVYLFAYRRGVTGMRIIVVGIGASLFLGAFNTWLLTTMRVENAISAASWGSGSLLDIAWSHTVPVIVAVLVAVPILVMGETDMRMMEMGDDIGRGLGVSAEAARLRMLLIAVALVAVVTASAGPIAFVALAAPQLAMRMCGTPGVRIIPSAVLGGLLLLASDMVARTILAPTQLPVGVVTLCVGGAYLVWLLASQGRKNR
ncbi:iron chelate uptake ABC transporter family permease subunit [Leucobacter sp. wl10]|uniref:FecCD family ABC transporter permease n=1 Tax=Leucobacter sp. wl10 TaxID=2304677 RepID=UPI001968CDAE|nr:iron chelate uptake ABC transporter family permease subunit [Leucobacter sp. wl10]